MTCLSTLTRAIGMNSAPDSFPPVMMIVLFIVFLQRLVDNKCRDPGPSELVEKLERITYA